LLPRLLQKESFNRQSRQAAEAIIQYARQTQIGIRKILSADDVSLSISLSLVLFQRLSVISQNMKRSRDPENTTLWVVDDACAIVLINTNLHTKFEVPSFGHFEDMTGPKNFVNGSRDPDYVHSGIVCHPKINRLLAVAFLCRKLKNFTVSQKRHTFHLL